MKVHLIKAQTVKNYAIEHSSAVRSFQEWINKISIADWNNPSDIPNTFATADILGRSSRRVVFNVGGNSYRIICAYHFSQTRVHLFVKWIGTHAEYDKLCSKSKQYSVDDF